MSPSCCPWLFRAICGTLGVALVGFGMPAFLLLNQCNLQRSSAQTKPNVNDSPMLGGSPSRNMVNLTAKNVPTKWHVEGGKLKNIKWAADLGTRAYGGPVVSGGRIFVGTNNQQPRDKNVKGFQAVVMCFREMDGKFLWQAVHPMSPAGVIQDALHDGMCSTPTVDGDRVYFVAPGCQLVCADVKDGKTVWMLDMMKELKVYPNRLGNCAPLIVGDSIFVVTGNARDGMTGKLIAPTAPGFAAVNKKTGKVLWEKNFAGKNVIDGHWSNPVYAKVNGVEQIIFPGSDCWMYSLEPKSGKLLWKFFCNSKKEEAEAKKHDRVPNYIVATPVVHGNKLYIGVGAYPEHPAAIKIGHFWCIDLVKATNLGKTNPGNDVSPQKDNFNPNAAVNKASALGWHFGGLLDPRPKFGRSVHFGRTISAAAVHDGLVYIAEEYGYMHCLDANTGKKHWEHDFRTSIWGSTYWVDNKIYIGTDDGDIFIFAHGAQKKQIGEPIYMEGAVQTTPVVANGTLYIMTKSKLYAIGAK